MYAKTLQALREKETELIKNQLDGLDVYVAGNATLCGNKKGQDYLNAKVLEITDTEIMVECIDETTNRLAGMTLSVSQNIISASGVPEIEIGDEIRVVYDFGKEKQSTIPVKIEHVYAIYLLDENGNIIM